MPSRSLRRAFAVATIVVLPVVTASAAAARNPDTRGRGTLCEDTAVTLRGTDGPDHLVGTESDDIILGFAGDDRIEGLGGNDIICGGDGSDRIDAGDGHDDVSQGNFSVNPDLGALDIVVLGEGDDGYFGFRDGAAFVDGGPGADYLSSSGEFDILVGGAGDDELWNASYLSSAPHGLTFGGDGNDQLGGGQGNDHLDGGAGADVISGGFGADMISGGPGADRIMPDEGQDFVDGGEGDDTIDGWTQNATALDQARPFSAVADSSLLRIDLPSLAGFGTLPATNVDLAHSTAAADSDGDVSSVEPGAQRAGASAATTGESSVLGAPLDLAPNQATAPPSESNEDVMLPLALDPLLSLDLLETSAIANWVSDTTCASATEPVSLADQTLADLSLIGLDGGRTVVALELDETDGAADTEVSTALPANGELNDGRDVQASAATRIAGVNLLNGFTGPGVSLIDVDVVQNPDYTVAASGLPGGAQVTGQDAVVDVSVGGTPVFTLTAGEAVAMPVVGLTLGDLIGGLDPMLAALQPDVRLSVPVSEDAAADGTSASVTASLLKVEILPPNPASMSAPVRDLLDTVLGAIGLDSTQPLGVIEVAPIAASVETPLGGISCGGLGLNPPEPGDMLLGSAGDDVIEGGSGGDFIVGGDGNDVASGMGHNDLMLGSAGDDVLVGGDGHDIVLGGVDADHLEGDAGTDYLLGEAGDDSFVGGDGGDHCDGGEGTDLDEGDPRCETPVAIP